MTLQEQLVKTVLSDFLHYLDILKEDEIIEKGLDNTSFPSIHNNEAEKGDESCI